MTARTLSITLLACPLLLVACKKAEVTAYRVPKEKDAEMPVAAAPTPTPVDSPHAPGASPTSPTMAGTPVPMAEGGGLTWTAPAQWVAKPASAMRKATYSLPGDNGATAELSITAIGGTAGGELANLNRWRGQVQLPPVAEGELSTAVTRIEHNGLKFGIVDLVGPGATPSGMLAAWVPVGDATWFFKLTGPETLLGKQKTAFTDFLATVRPTAP